MNAKRILVDARCIGGEGQGMLTYLVGLYQAIHAQYQGEYKIYFAGFHFSAVQAAFPWITEDDFIQLPQKSKWQLFLFTFPKIIRQFNIDFAHFQYMVPFVKNCKFIVTTHDVLFLDFPKEFSWSYRIQRKFLFYLSLLRSEVRLTVSEYSKKRLVHHFGFKSASIAITPNAVNEKYLTPYNQPKIREELYIKYGVENYILFVSRIEKRKNQAQLLDSYEELKLADKDIQLVLVGNNTLDNQTLSDKINLAKRKYPGKVHWYKNLAEEELLKFYQGANLFVYPSRAEGFGIPPIESAALGINTICAANTAMQDFTFFGDNLYEDQIAANLSRVIEKNLRRPTPQKALDARVEAIKKRYSWNTAANSLHHQIAALVD